MSEGIKIMSGATVSEESKLHGDITIGDGTVIRPTASIIAEAGPIMIGKGCVIQQRAKIINKGNNEGVKVMTIGTGNVFGIDSTIEALNIGNGNVFQSKCFVGNKVTVRNGCVIGDGSRLTEKQTLQDGTVVQD